MPRSLAGPAFDTHVRSQFEQQSGSFNSTIASSWAQLIERIMVFGKTALMSLTPEGQARIGEAQLQIDLTPFIMTRRRRDIIGQDPQRRPIRAETRASLLEAIARARLWLDQLAFGRIASIEALAKREGQTLRQVTATLSHAFLAPNIVSGAIDGTLPDGIGTARLRDLPLEWDRQREAAGLTRRA